MSRKAKADGEIGVEELSMTYENNKGGRLGASPPWDQHEHKKTNTAQII